MRQRILASIIPDLIFNVHKPSANQGKARLRRLWRITCSKTISLLEALSCQLSAIGY